MIFKNVKPMNLVQVVLRPVTAREDRGATRSCTGNVPGDARTDGQEITVKVSAVIFSKGYNTQYYFTYGIFHLYK